MEINTELIAGSILAGVAIGIGGTAYLSTGYAWLFPIGLIMVCYFSLYLFTGKVCWFVFRKKGAIGYAVCFILNAISAYLTGMIIAFSKLNLIDKAKTMTEAKLSEGLKLIPLAILCNIMIFAAVTSYRETQSIWILIFATTVFVACGFEHCIANSFYFGVAGEFGVSSLLYLIVNAIFNAVGGIAACRVINFCIRRLNG